MSPEQSLKFTYYQAELESVKAKFLHLLATIPEVDWNKGARYDGYHTVEQMAHRPAEHLAEHAEPLKHLPGSENEEARRSK